MDSKILVTGGDGRFAKLLKSKNKKLNLIFCSKKQLDILNLKSIKKNFEQHKPKIIFHCAGLSRPMNIHEEDIAKSIDLNIIGTANLVKICKLYKIKLIYFPQAMFMRVRKVIIKKQMLLNHLTIMVYQN